MYDLEVGNAVACVYVGMVCVLDDLCSVVIISIYMLVIGNTVVLDFIM